MLGLPPVTMIPPPVPKLPPVPLSPPLAPVKPEEPPALLAVTLLFPEHALPKMASVAVTA